MLEFQTLSPRFLADIGTYISRITGDNINRFLVAKLLPQTIRCENEKLILGVEPVHEYGWLWAKNRPAEGSRQPELGQERFSVELRPLEVGITNGSRHLSLQQNKPVIIPPCLVAAVFWSERHCHTWMMPFTRQTLCFDTTICGSSGCKLRSSFLTDSRLALCSVDNWTAVTPLPLLSALPKTARESPAFATCRIPLHITPTKQHVPTEAICGFVDHCCLTRHRNSSSVAKNAFLITSADTSCPSEANSAPTRQSPKILLEYTLK